jgi:hypothetical protein
MEPEYLSLCWKEPVQPHTHLNMLENCVPLSIEMCRLEMKFERKSKNNSKCLLH